MPTLSELRTHADTQGLLRVGLQAAVLDEQEHHVRANLLRPKGGNSNWKLNELVKIVCDKLIFDTLKMPLDRVLDHLIIGGNHKGGVLEEQQQPDGLKG